MNRHLTHLRPWLALLFLGIATVLPLSGQPWTQVGADIDGAAAGDRFGYSVSMSDDGTRVAVGASEHDGYRGQVRIFEYDGSSWTQLGADIDGDAADDQCGWAVSLSGDGNRVAIGAPFNDDAGGNAGQVRVYEYSGGTWTQLGADIDGDVADDRSGISVSLNTDGTRLAIGAPTNDGNGNESGQVRIYEYSGGTWSQLGADIDGEVAGDQSGFSVSLSSNGSRVAIGAIYNGASGPNAGHTRIYEYSGGTWSQLGADIDAEAAGDLSGWSVSLSSDGSRVAIGAYRNQGNGLQAGHVRIYEYSVGTWTQLGADLDGEAAGDESGRSVSLNGDGSRVAIGARGNGDVGYIAGHVRVYEYDGSAWAQVETDIDGEADWNYSGHSVSMNDDGSRVAIGAILNSDNGSFAGHVRVFESAWNHGPHGGYALDFDGVDDLAIRSNPADLAILGDLTLEVWAKFDQLNPGSNTLICKGSGAAGEAEADNILYILRINDSKQLSYFWEYGSGTNQGGNSTVAANINAGEWHHYAMVRNSAAKTVTFYVDGKQLGSPLSYTNDPTGGTTAPFVIASEYDNGAGTGYSFWDGQIDEVRVWNDVRTQAEIQAYLHKELAGNEANLQAYYPMYNGTGTSLTDVSNNGHTGTLTNGPAWKTSGAHAGPGMALDFDGTNDFVSLPADLTDLTAAFTLEAWVRPEDVSLAGAWRRRILSLAGTNDLDVAVMGDLTVSFRTSNGPLNQVSSATVAINAWNHLALVFDGSTYSMYLNGNSTPLSGGGLTDLGGGSNSFIGNIAGNLAPFDGQIDEVRIWSGARTEAEIRSNMYRTLDGDEANLAAYYRFDQQPDAAHIAAYDQTANGHHGTLTNMAPATDWVAASPFNTWIGSEDGDWNNAANWSRAVVPSTEDIGIYAWSGNNLPASANINARHAYVDAGATFSHGGNLTLSGDLINEGTFTTTGTVTFSGSAAQRIIGSGTTTIGTLMIDNAAGVSLEQDVTTTTTLNLNNGAFSIGANTLTVNGSITKGPGTLSGGASSNLVIGGGGASTGLSAVTLNDLTLNRANGLSLIDNVTVGGTLTLTNGELALNTHTLTLGETASIGGTPGAGNHIVATSGTLRKQYAGPGSFSFPVGDGTHYTPLALNFTSGAFASGQADVNLVASKHPNNTSATDFINRYWAVNTSGITGFSCNLTATYADADVAGTEGNLTGGKWDGATWTMLDAVNGATNAITGTVSSFSDITAGEAATFPVEWLSFDALPQGQQVNLRWQTATEVNSHYFGVERSRDEASWQPVGQVLAAGNSESVRRYDFIDEPGEAGQWYYRLRQVDLDGTFSYSPQVAVLLDEEPLRFYPNPVQDRLHLEARGSWRAQIVDQTGRLVGDYAGEGPQKLDLSTLPSGVYLLRLQQVTQQQSRSFIKE